MTESQIEPRLYLNGFYRSDPMLHVNYEAGERTEEEYFLYYQFLESGIWVCKTHASPELNFSAFLSTINLKHIEADPHHDEPQLGNKDLFYQSGTYVLYADRVKLLWKNSNLEDKSRIWEFILIGDRLATPLRDYGFEFIPF